MRKMAGRFFLCILSLITVLWFVTPSVHALPEIYTVQEMNQPGLPLSLNNNGEILSLWTYGTEAGAYRCSADGSCMPLSPDGETPYVGTDIDNNNNVAGWYLNQELNKLYPFLNDAPIAGADSGKLIYTYLTIPDAINYVLINDDQKIATIVNKVVTDESDPDFGIARDTLISWIGSDYNNNNHLKITYSEANAAPGIVLSDMNGNNAVGNCTPTTLGGGPFFWDTTTSSLVFLKDADGNTGVGPEVFSINSSNQMVGRTGDAINAQRAVYWKNENEPLIVLNLLDPLNHNYSNAYDINENGQIVGISAQISQDNGVTTIHSWNYVVWEPQPDGTYGSPVSIMDRTGGYPLAYQISNEDEAFVLGVMSFLGIMARINDSGQIAVVVKQEGDAPKTVLLSENDACTEDSTGVLDVVGKTVFVDPVADTTEVSVDIQIANPGAPNLVDAFGFEIVFDPQVLTYIGATRGDLLATFDLENLGNFGANKVSEGVLRIGGYMTDGEIQSGANGILAHLVFSVPRGTTGSTEITIRNLVDDFIPPTAAVIWPASGGCITFEDESDCHDPLATGDINHDDAITPADALCALEKATGICDTTCGPCGDNPPVEPDPENPIYVHCDVNSDCDCTALDSLCIFNKYLELPSCLDSVVADLEVAGNWTGSGTPEMCAQDYSVAMTNDSFSLDCMGTITNGSIVSYNNEENYFIISNPSSPYGEFQKISWLEETPGTPVTFQAYAPAATTEDALLTSMVLQFVLTRIQQ